VAKQLIKSIFFGLVVIIICTPFNGIFGEKSLKAIHNICPLNQKLKRGFTETGILTDQLDQYQTEDCGYGIMIFDGYWCAQAFKPSLGILTKVQLYMFRYGNPSNNIQITISIKSSLTGGDLTMAAVYGRQISNQGNWVEFNFPDINVVVGSTYYIVCRASGGNIDNNYCWLFGMNNPYKKGDAWLSDDYGNSWYVFDYPPDFPDADFCFKTYGKEGMQGNYYALIIGISDYPGTENDLSCPSKDALAIKNALLAGNNWHSNNIKFLVNEQASVSNVYPQYPQYHQHPQIYDGIYGQLPILNNILNKPPNKPNKPVGPTYGKRFRIYTYSTSTNDPNGDEIYYFFYWGDRTFSGWIGPYSSGQTVTASHWWFRGTYSIRVMAMDEHGAKKYNIYF